MGMVYSLTLNEVGKNQEGFNEDETDERRIRSISFDVDCRIRKVYAEEQRIMGPFYDERQDLRHVLHHVLHHVMHHVIHHVTCASHARFETSMQDSRFI